jgi:hypothetical protein
MKKTLLLLFFAVVFITSAQQDKEATSPVSIDICYF